MQPVDFACGAPEPCVCVILFALIQVRCPPGSYVKEDDFKGYRLVYLPPDLTVRTRTMTLPSDLNPDPMPTLATHAPDTPPAYKTTIDEIPKWSEGEKAMVTLLGAIITFLGTALGVYLQKVVTLVSLVLSLVNQFLPNHFIILETS